MDKAEREGAIEFNGGSFDQAELSAPKCAARRLARQRFYASAMQYGKRALTLASTGEQKVRALMRVAEIHFQNELYADARTYLSQALKIDDCNVQVIGNLVGCYCIDGKGQEAVQLAKRGLMLAPDNSVCKWYADYPPSSSSTGGIFDWPD